MTIEGREQMINAYDSVKLRAKKRRERKGEKGAVSILMIILIAVLIISWGVIGWLLIGNHSEMNEDPVAVEKAEVQALLKDDQDERGLFPLETLIVNLEDDNAARYLKTTIKIELTNKAMVNELQKDEITKAKMLDTILLVLSSKKYAELLNIEGRMKVRQELILRLNGIVRDQGVRNIYFTEFVVQ